MMNTVSGDGGFQTADVIVNDPSNYVLIDTICVPEGFRGRPYIVKGIVGAGGAIAGLKFTEAAVPEDTHYALAQDDDLDTATSLFPFATASAYQTPASGSFVIRFHAAPPEFAVYARKASADTTLRIIGSILF